MTRTVEVVVELKRYMPEKCHEFIDYLVNELSKIPEPLREGVELCIELDSDYNEDYISYALNYHRPETDLERIELLTKVKNKRERDEEFDRRHYAYLKAKFEGGDRR
jgi:hypothetical protein